MKAKVNIAIGLTLLYAILTVPSLGGAALLWGNFATNKLFHCSDSLGPFDFIPPFVHASSHGDHYIAPAWIAWLLWSCLLILSQIPALSLIFFLVGNRRRTGSHQFSRSTTA